MSLNREAAQWMIKHAKVRDGYGENMCAYCHWFDKGNPKCPWEKHYKPGLKADQILNRCKQDECIATKNGIQECPEFRGG